MTDEYELTPIIRELNDIGDYLYIINAVEDEDGVHVEKYTITEVLQDMIAAIDRNTAAITALKAELETAQLQNRQ